MGALMMLLIAAGLAVGSGASFTAQSASPGNMITADSLSVDNDKKNDGVQGAIFSVTNMKPGDVENGYVTVANTGSVAGDFTLDLSSLTAGGPGANLAGRLS